MTARDKDADAKLYLKSGPETDPAFDARGLAPFNYGRAGRVIQMSYREAPPEVYEDPEAAARWGRRALGAAIASNRKRP